MKNFWYHLSLIKSWIYAQFSQQKYLHAERFSYPHERIAFSTETPSEDDLLLGIDEFGRYLQVTTNKRRKQLGNVLKVASSPAIPGRHLTCWKQKAYFLRFRKHKSNKINDIFFLETHDQGNSDLNRWKIWHYLYESRKYNPLKLKHLSAVRESLHWEVLWHRGVGVFVSDPCVPWWDASGAILECIATSVCPSLASDHQPGGTQCQNEAGKSS